MEKKKWKKEKEKGKSYFYVGFVFALFSKFFRISFKLA